MDAVVSNKFIPTTDACDGYLSERTGRYEQRRVRYTAVGDEMVKGGLTDEMTVMDIGAGWTEFDYCLRTDYQWRGRYIPVDGGIDNTDLNNWTPPRKVDWVVAIEILEHLDNPYHFTKVMMNYVTKGIVFTTPNPRTTDVLGMDSTHVVEIDVEVMRDMGFNVWERTLYGGVFSNGQPDSLVGLWLNE